MKKVKILQSTVDEINNFQSTSYEECLVFMSENKIYSDEIWRGDGRSYMNVEYKGIEIGTLSTTYDGNENIYYFNINTIEDVCIILDDSNQNKEQELVILVISDRETGKILLTDVKDEIVEFKDFECYVEEVKITPYYDYCEDSEITKEFKIEFIEKKLIINPKSIEIN